MERIAIAPLTDRSMEPSCSGHINALPAAEVIGSTLDLGLCGEHSAGAGVLCHIFLRIAVGSGCDEEGLHILAAEAAAGDLLHGELYILNVIEILVPHADDAAPVADIDIVLHVDADAVGHTQTALEIQHGTGTGNGTLIEIVIEGKELLMIGIDNQHGLVVGGPYHGVILLDTVNDLLDGLIGVDHIESADLIGSIVIRAVGLGNATHEETASRVAAAVVVSVFLIAVFGVNNKRHFAGRKVKKVCAGLNVYEDFAGILAGDGGTDDTAGDPLFVFAGLGVVAMHVTGKQIGPIELADTPIPDGGLGDRKFAVDDQFEVHMRLLSKC